MQTSPMIISARLEILRRDRKLTQTEFADRLRIARGSYKHYENGTRAIPVSVIETLVIEEGVDARVRRQGFWHQMLPQCKA